MKKVIIAIILAITSFCAQAQTLEGNRYKGALDFMISPGNDGVFYKFNTFSFGLLNTHGYQINPYVFVGVGIGIQYHCMKNFENSISVPIYSNVRFNFTQSKTSPYFDLKGGYSIYEIEGLYLSPSFGLRFGLNNNMAANLQVGYSAQRFNYIDYYYISRSYIHSLNISFGVEW